MRLTKAVSSQDMSSLGVVNGNRNKIFGRPSGRGMVGPSSATSAIENTIHLESLMGISPRFMLRSAQRTFTTVQDVGGNSSTLAS